MLSADVCERDLRPFIPGAGPHKSKRRKAEDPQFRWSASVRECDRRRILPRNKPFPPIDPDGRGRAPVRSCQIEHVYHLALHVLTVAILRMGYSRFQCQSSHALRARGIAGFWRALVGHTPRDPGPFRFGPIINTIALEPARFPDKWVLVGHSACPSAKLAG